MMVARTRVEECAVVERGGTMTSCKNSLAIVNLGVILRVLAFLFVGPSGFL